MKTKISLLLFIVSLLPIIVFGQSSITFDTGDEYYYRVLQISGISKDDVSYSLRPYFLNETIDEDHPWKDVLKWQEESYYSYSDYFGIDFFEPVFFQSYNTTVPRGTKDGPVWQGKGYNMAFTTGAKASFGPLHIRFRPVVGMAQNRSFDLGPYKLFRVRSGLHKDVELSEFAYRDFRGSIDYVQRYGDSSYSWFDLGDSSVELRYSGFRLALSNRQIWTGPAVNTSLQYGYSAPGFRHFYAGTYRPVNTVAGSFEFAYIFGKMQESDYFTVNRVVNLQSVNSFVVIYKPWFADHFSIGAIRTFFHEFPDSFSEYTTQAKKLFQTGLKSSIANEENPTGHNLDNQIAAIFFRYYLPEYGFEFYWEYGRNDHNADWRDFLAQPNHHRAYNVGVTKTVKLPNNRLLAVNFEINQHEAMRTALTRGDRHLGGWFTHTNQIMGFTNQGQIPGTGYGPGVNMQTLKADLYESRGGIGLKLARITYHNSRLDQFFQNIQAANSETVEPREVRNVELLIGAELKAFLPYNIELSAALEQSFIINQYYLKNNDLTNTRLELVVRKQINGWLR